MGRSSQIRHCRALHQRGDGLPYPFPMGMHRAGSSLGAAIAPKNTAGKGVGPFDCQQNISYVDRVWTTGKGVTTNGAARRGDDVCPIKLLKYLRKKILRYPSRVRDVAQLHRRAEGGFRQHNQSLNGVSTFLAEFHSDGIESTDDLSPLATRYAIVVPSTILNVFTALYRQTRETLFRNAKVPLGPFQLLRQGSWVRHKRTLFRVSPVFVASNFSEQQEGRMVSNWWRIIVDAVIWMGARFARPPSI